METHERVNVEMLKLTIQNKGLKRRMVVWKTLQQECQERKKKKEAWNDTDHAYQKALIEYKYKNEGLEREGIVVVGIRPQKSNN